MKTLTQRLDFSESEAATIIITCRDEIKYWEEMDFHPFFVDNAGKLQRYSDKERERIKSRLNADFKKSIAIKKVKMAKLYNEINNKLIKDDKEFTEEEVHWIKIMCQECIPRMSKCLIVKHQIDGSITPNRVPGLLHVAFETTRSECIKTLNRVINQLSLIDTIPGEGVAEPRAYTFPGGSVLDKQ